MFSQARPWRTDPRHGWCPHRRGHFVGRKAAPSWPIEKPPASEYLVLPSNGQSIVSTDIHTAIHPYTQTKTNTTTCLERGNHKSLFVCFNVVLFLETEVFWQMPYSGKWEENWFRRRISRVLACSRLFIVWVCLQIYCSEHKTAFFPLWTFSKGTGNTRLLLRPLCLKISTDHIISVWCKGFHFPGTCTISGHRKKRTAFNYESMLGQAHSHCMTK